MRFNSVTGLSALKMQGGYAAARYWQSKDWSHQKTISPLGVRARIRLHLVRIVPSIDQKCRTATGLSLVEVAKLHERGLLEVSLLGSSDTQSNARRKKTK